MRLSVAVKLELLDVHRPAVPLEEMPMAHVGPLAAFIAQITVPYLQLPNASASQRKTRENAVGNYENLSVAVAPKFSRSV